MIRERTEMIEAVLRLWTMGFDTQRIANVLLEKQCNIERWLHIGLEERRRHANENADLQKPFR